MLKSSSVDLQRQHCSWKTLQSEERGLFSAWLAEIVRCNPGAVENILTFSSEEERVLYCSSLLQVDRFAVAPVYKQKDPEMAKQRRDEGNMAFQKKWYKQAHMMYSMSAIKSVPGSDVLAYSIANRSACLYYLGEINQCIADINLALVYGYPPQLHYKLYERLAKCYILLKDKENAMKSALTAKKMLERNKSKFDKEKYQSSMKTLLKLGSSVNNPETFSDNITVVKDPVVKVPAVSMKPHRKLKDFSSLLRVEFDPAVGRHVKAEKTVKPGDTLLVEDPFAAVLYPDKAGTNCDNCFSKLRSVVPCPDCSGIGFCSKECRDEACASYHKYECKFQDLVHGLGGSALVRLALRIITSHPLTYFKKMRTDLNVDNTTSEFKHPYLSLFNLVSLDEERWTEDIFTRSMMAVALLKILKEAKYFPDKADADTYTDDEIFIGALILRHLNLLQFNAHEVYEVLRGNRDKIKPTKNNLIGLAVYSRASYFNHSCQPNVTRLNIGRKLVMKSLVRVEKGEEVSDNYGPVFYFKPKDERQRELSARYWFQCKCSACSADWSLLGKNSEPRWRDGEDQGKLDFLESVYKCGADFLENGQRNEAVENLVESINGLYELVLPPLDTLTRAEDKLRTCFNDMGTVVFSDTALKFNPAEKSNNPMIK